MDPHDPERNLPYYAKGHQTLKYDLTKFSHLWHLIKLNKTTKSKLANVFSNFKIKGLQVVVLMGKTLTLRLVILTL